MSQEVEFEQKKYNKFVEELVPVNSTDMEMVRGKSISNDIDLSKGLSILEKNIKTRELIPKDIDEVPEPDDAEIEKMILNDDEKALKTRLWKSLNHDWIA